MVGDNSEKRLGKLEPRHTFFLNPYKDARFTNCPKCGEKMRARKKPFLVHVDPMHLVALNMTGRYCPDCDLLILHQDVLEDLLARLFSSHDPSAIGNEYLVVGTVERPYFHKHKEGAGTIGAAIENLHDFQEVVIFEPAHYGWVREEEE